MIKFASAWSVCGLLIYVFGCGPLMLYSLAVKVGLLSTGGNPVGLGLLYFVSAIAFYGFLVIGALLWIGIAVRKIFAACA